MLGTFILSLVGCLYYNKICPPQEVSKLQVVLSTINNILSTKYYILSTKYYPVPSANNRHRASDLESTMQK